MSRLRWWAAGTAIGLIVVVAVGAQIWRSTHPRPPIIATVTPSLDRSIAGVVAAVGNGAAVTVTGLVPTTSCRGGSIFTVTANLYTNPGSEGEVVDRIAASIPATEQPSRAASSGGDAPSLYANLGDGAQLQVIQVDQGWISATATSDCRSAPPSAAARASVPTAATASLAREITALGSAPGAFHTDAVMCASGQIVTVSTVSGPMSLADVHAHLAALPPAGATTFASSSDRISWRVGETSTVVAASDDGTHVTAQQTTSC